MSWEFEGLFEREEPEDGQQDFWSSQPTSVRVGQMGYRTKTTKAGERLEAEVYPIYGRQDKGRLRAAKKAKSRKAVQDLNERRAKRHLVNLIETNFHRGDHHILLTYETEPTEARAKKDIYNFLRRLRRMREKKGLPELKYIYAMGGGEEDDEKRIHFHLMTNKGLTEEEIIACWNMTPGAGIANRDILQPDENGLEALSQYFFKQHKDRAAADQIGKHSYCPSRNLKQPKVRTSDTKCSNARVRRIAHDIRNEAKAEMEKIYPGYRFIDCSVRYSDIISGVYIRCVMRRREEVRWK